MSETTKPTEDKKTRVITMTLPVPLVDAIESEVSDLSMPAGEAVKHWLTTAYMHPQGIQLKLTRLAPSTAAKRDDQLELPIVESTPMQG